MKQSSAEANYELRKAVFPGSFDPFTVGHDAIVRRALPLFDKIIIGVGVNVRKKYLYSADKRVEDIARTYAGEPKIEVKAYSGLLTDFARREGARFIIKGVRSVKDFEYEREQADINLMIGGVETLIMFSEPQYQSVSSSMVRELMHFGRDVSEFIPNK